MMVLLDLFLPVPGIGWSIMQIALITYPTTLTLSFIPVVSAYDGAMITMLVLQI